MIRLIQGGSIGGEFSGCIAFLVEYSPWFGKNIVPYFLWAALNDQFINARLDTIYYSKLFFRIFDIASADVEASILTFCQKYGIPIYPLDNELFFSCWDKFIKIIQSKSIDGVKNITQTNVDGVRNDRYARPIILKQAFLKLQFKTLTGRQLSSKSLSKYLLHQCVCAKMNRFKKQHHIGKSYLELYHSLDAVKEQIELCFNGELPMNYTGQRIELNNALQRFGEALKNVWLSDPYLKATTWHIPDGVKNLDVQKLYKTWRQGFVDGDKKRLRTSDGTDGRILRNIIYLHKTLPEKYVKEGFKMEPVI